MQGSSNAASCAWLLAPPGAQARFEVLWLGSLAAPASIAPFRSGVLEVADAALRLSGSMAARARQSTPVAWRHSGHGWPVSGKPMRFQCPGAEGGASEAVDVLFAWQLSAGASAHMMGEGRGGAAEEEQLRRLIVVHRSRSAAAVGSRSGSADDASVPLYVIGEAAEAEIAAGVANRTSAACAQHQAAKGLGPVSSAVLVPGLGVVVPWNSSPKGASLPLPDGDNGLLRDAGRGAAAMLMGLQTAGAWWGDAACDASLSAQAAEHHATAAARRLALAATMAGRASVAPGRGTTADAAQALALCSAPDAARVPEALARASQLAQRLLDSPSLGVREHTDDVNLAAALLPGLLPLLSPVVMAVGDSFRSLPLLKD